MSSVRSSSWPAQEPTIGFAARTVGAMLASGQRQGRSKRPRVAFFWALAAVLATGTAMAIWGASRPVHVQLGATPVGAAKIEPLDITLQSHLLVASSHAVAEPSVPRAARNGAPAASSRAVQPVPSSSARLPLRQPACECERGFSDFICDCY